MGAFITRATSVQWTLDLEYLGSVVKPIYRSTTLLKTKNSVDENLLLVYMLSVVASCYLVVNNNMKDSAGRVFRQISQMQGFIDNTLSREGSIAVNQNGDRLFANWKR